jgi:cytochrome P450
MTATFLDPMAVAQIISRSRLNDSFSNTVWYLHADMSSIEIYIWFVGAIGVLVIASIHILRYCLKYRPPPGLKLPSGPRSDLPYIGKFLGIDTRAPWYRMKELCDIYGGIWQLISCGDMHVWIGDLKIAQDLLCTKSAIYSSRPMVPAIPGSDSQGQYLPLLAHNGIEHPHGLEDLMADSMTDHWRAQRKFAHTVLLQSSQREYYGYIAVEAKRYLYKLLMDPTDHFALTDRFCGRISSRLAYGRPDSAAAHCKNAFEFLGQLAPSGSVINLMPFLGSLPEWLIPSKKQVRLRREREENLWKGLMEQVRKDMDQGFAPVSYATTYINRRKTEKAFSFDDDEAAYAVGMLCTVSIFTIGGALYGFILAMVLHPEWQEKVREEVEGLLRTTKKDIIELSDSPKLPLLRASIKEYFRWRPVVPLGDYWFPSTAVVNIANKA